MGAIGRWLRRAVTLPLWLTAVLAIAAAALLSVTLTRPDVPGWLLMISYHFSAYALTTCITAAMRLTLRLKRQWKVLSRVLRGLPMGKLLLDDVFFRTWTFTWLSLLWNLLVALVKLGAGVAVRSVWLQTLGVYYLLLAVLRFGIVHPGGKHPGEFTRMSALERYRRCGVILMGMNLVLMIMVVQAVRDESGFRYPGSLIYLMAAYVFWAVINATVKLARYHRGNDPLISAARAVSLTAAMVSMLALQTALLSRFDTGDGLFRGAMNAALGGVICLVEWSIALYMIVHGTREMRRVTAETNQ